MSNTHAHSTFFLHHLTVAALLIGILSVGTATQSHLLAQLSGGGATAVQFHQPVAASHASAQLMQAPEVLHSAAPWQLQERSIYTQHQLLLGMLLVLLGFVLHYLSIRLFGAERRVPVHAATLAWYNRYIDTDLADFYAAYREDDLDDQD